MFSPTRVILIVNLCLVATVAYSQAAPCPGFDRKHNVNLACEIATAVRISTSGSQTLGQLSPTVAAQLSQLPLTTASSGSGLTFSKSLGIITASNDSLGTILTQRGDTIGRHNFFVSFDYQRFGFGSIDGISLKHLDTINQAVSGTSTIFVQSTNRVDLLVDQLSSVASFGLTSNVDLSVLVPFAKVTLKTGSSGTQFISSATDPIPLVNTFLAGSAFGLGDVAVNVKYNVVRFEHTKIAVGNEVRFPTGDATNYLGTGAYGVKPYFVISRSGKITPNVNIGYQWNGSSILFVNPTSGAHLNLPSSFLYSGGVDYRLFDRLSLSTEFLGQAVIDGPRLAKGTTTIFNQPQPFATATTVSSSYAMDNLGVGFKVNPFKGLLINGNVLFQLDSGGLRSKVVPLVGISYRFSR